MNKKLQPQEIVSIGYEEAPQAPNPGIGDLTVAFESRIISPVFFGSFIPKFQA
jgi:hypothetical protein